jgi:hypothetical protein
MVFGSEGNSGLASLAKDRGRASTLYTTRDRARKPASRDEDRFILRERTRRETVQVRNKNGCDRRLYTLDLHRLGPRKSGVNTSWHVTAVPLSTEYRAWILP